MTKKVSFHLQESLACYYQRSEVETTEVKVLRWQTLSGKVFITKVIQLVYFPLDQGVRFIRKISMPVLS